MPRAATSPREIQRCVWAKVEPEISYHDNEWGVPEHDDRMLFELLTLEGAQAGLSWSTVLRKRDGYRKAFAGFDPAIVAAFDEARCDEIVLDPGIVRHRGKIDATVKNAKAFLAVQREFGSFDAYLWGFAGGKTIVSRRGADEDYPATSDLSDRLSKDLRNRGFGFVGSTIVYAYLQATGVLDDHRPPCFRAVGKAVRRG